MTSTLVVVCELVFCPACTWHGLLLSDNVSSKLYVVAMPSAFRFEGISVTMLMLRALQVKLAALASVLHGQNG